MEGSLAIQHGKVKGYTDRNLQIFKDMKNKNINFTPRDIFYYANELSDNRYYEESLVEYRKFIDTKQGWVEDIKRAYSKMILAVKMLNRKDEIVDLAFESFKVDKPTAEIVCNLAEYYIEKSNFNLAAFWYRVAMDSKPDNKLTLVNEAYYGWIPSIQLSVCYFNLKNLKCSYFFNELAASLGAPTEKIEYNRSFFESEFKKYNIKAPSLEYPLRLSDYEKYL